MAVAAIVTLSSCTQGENRNYETFIEHFSETAAHAYVQIDNHQILLVSHETFGNNENSDLMAIEASIFAQDSEGKIVSLGSIRSQGTLYPVSISDNQLMVAGHQFVKIYTIRYEEQPELVLETYEEGESEKLTDLFTTFEEATPILFFKGQ